MKKLLFAAAMLLALGFNAGNLQAGESFGILTSDMNLTDDVELCFT